MSKRNNTDNGSFIFFSHISELNKFYIINSENFRCIYCIEVWVQRTADDTVWFQVYKTTLRFEISILSFHNRLMLGNMGNDWIMVGKELLSIGCISAVIMNGSGKGNIRINRY